MQSDNRIRSLISVSVAIAVFFVATIPCAAVTRVFTGTGEWGDTTRWSGGVVPTSADRVEIQGTCLIGTGVTPRSAFADTIDVKSGALLRVVNGSLTLDNNNDHVVGTPDNSIVDGEVHLGSVIDGSPGTLRFEGSNHTITGGGWIFGKKDGLILIDGVQFTNSLTPSASFPYGCIEGGDMTIQGLIGDDGEVGTFENRGLVLSRNGLVVVDSVFFDSSNAEWKIDSCGGEMWFKSGSLILLGDFIGWSGGSGCPSLFRFDQDIATCGTWIRNSGGVTLGAAATFLYANFAVGNASVICTGNPAATTSAGEPGPSSCEDPWMLENSVSGCRECGAGDCGIS